MAATCRAPVRALRHRVHSQATTLKQSPGMLLGVTDNLFPTVSSPRLADLIAEKLRDQVRRGILRPGDRLPPEAELMRQFGVSRPTLREALRMLEHDELISVHRGMRGGASVRVPGGRPLARAIADQSLRLPGEVVDAASLADVSDAELRQLLSALHQALAKRETQIRRAA
jgi:GntR family transcriptional repressor for pyruvate dehydrogenase complex